MTPPKLCAGCLTRPRRYACLRCGDALCRRCVAARACCAPPAVPAGEPPAPLSSERVKLVLDDRHVERAAAIEQCGGINSVMRGDDLATLPQTTSAATLSPEEPPAALSETPSTGTTPRLPADAGGGRAVPASLKARILSLAAAGPVSVDRVCAELDAKRESVCSTLSIMTTAGLLRRVGRGEYARGDAELREPAKRVQPAVARRNPCAPGTPAAIHPRVRGPVAGVHRTAADFFAAKEPLPPARPPVVAERGRRHA